MPPASWAYLRSLCTSPSETPKEWEEKRPTSCLGFPLASAAFPVCWMRRLARARKKLIRKLRASFSSRFLGAPVHLLSGRAPRVAGGQGGGKAHQCPPASDLWEATSWSSLAAFTVSEIGTSVASRILVILFAVFCQVFSLILFLLKGKQKGRYFTSHRQCSEGGSSHRGADSKNDGVLLKYTSQNWNKRYYYQKVVIYQAEPLSGSLSETLSVCLASTNVYCIGLLTWAVIWISQPTNRQDIFLSAIKIQVSCESKKQQGSDAKKLKHGTVFFEPWNTSDTKKSLIT